MNGTLLIYAPDLDKGDLLWHHLGQGAAAQQGTASWQDNEAMSALSARSLDAFTLVLLPGDQVRWFSVPMPSKQRALIASLPFQIEDQISTPIEQIHVVPGIFKDGFHTALAIEHSILAEIIGALANHQIQPNLITADYLLLEAPNQADAQNTGVIIKHRDHVLIKTPLWSGRVHQSLFPLIKPRLIENTNEESSAESLTESAEVPTTAELKVQGLDDAALLSHFFKAFNAKRPPFTLLTGPYEHQSPWQQWLQPYKKPLWAAAALAVITFGLLIIQNLSLQQQVNQLDDAMATLYKDTFPEARRISNPIAQLRGALRQSGQNGGDDAVLIWLSKAAPLLSKEKVTLLNLRFTQAPDTLRLQLQADDYSAIERISSTLGQQGLQAELGTLVRNDQHVSGLLTIRGS